MLLGDGAESLMQAGWTVVMMTGYVSVEVSGEREEFIESDDSGYDRLDEKEHLAKKGMGSCKLGI